MDMTGLMLTEIHDIKLMKVGGSPGNRNWYEDTIAFIELASITAIKQELAEGGQVGE